MHGLMVAAALAAAPAAGAAQDMRVAALPADGTMLEVTAEGRATRVPDVATIRAGVVTQAASAAAAMAENARRMTAVVASLRKAGVAERDLRTATIGLQPQYRYVENQAPVLTGYQATNSVAVRFRDIARSGAILDALVAAGANQIDGPDLSIDRPEAALDEARTDAVAKARARATLYAGAAGLRVARIMSITEGAQETGGPAPMPRMMAMRGDAAASTPIAAGERDVTVGVTVRFLLQ